MNALQKLRIDWMLFASTVPLLAAGLLTMHSLGDDAVLFEKQLFSIGVSLAVFFLFASFDFRFLRSTKVIMALYILGIFLLLTLFFFGQVTHGAQSWFHVGGLSFEPADPMKLVVILLLAKYFSRRHIEIANVRHVLLSGFYVFVPFMLIALQPDFGSAMVLVVIWFSLVLLSGISKKHLFFMLIIAALSSFFLWNFAFHDYQRERILSFINPLSDRQGAGYNAFQAAVAVGSGEMLGRGFGFGTQSRLNFLPEYETDFVFAAFAEEWGFVGVLLVFLFFGVVIWRILAIAIRGETNFEMLYGIGLAILITTHFTINIGMNIGLLPVAGITLPFMSYGGTHLLTEFAGLGILMGMRAYSRPAHRDDTKNEFLQVAGE